MQEHLKLYEDKMEKSLDVLLDEYASIRAGRANPHVLDRLRIDYYGTPTPIQRSERNRSGSTHDRDPAVGEEPVKRD